MTFFKCTNFAFTFVFSFLRLLRNLRVLCVLNPGI
jgi:hypothetical protein